MLDFLTLNHLLLIGIGAAVIFGIWRIANPKYDVRIVLTPDGIQQVAGVKQQLREELDDFLRKNLPSEGKVVIGGLRDRMGRLRLFFHGPIDKGRQQRFRNFFGVMF